MIFVVVMVLAVVAPIVAWYTHARDRRAIAPAVGSVAISPRPRRDPALRGAPSAWPKVLPLARVEARRLVRHPATYLIATPLLALAFSNLAYSAVFVHERNDIEVAVYLVPYAWGVLIASNLSTLRSRRWRTEELVSSTPMSERSRTLAHLLATVAMVPGALLLVVLTVVLAALSGRAIGTPQLAPLLVAPLLALGAGCVGVAVARWLPRPAFGWVAVVATFVLQANFGQLHPEWRWLHFSVAAGEEISYPDLAPAHHEVHLLYLLAGIALVAVVALARDGLDRRLAAALVGAVSVLLLTGFVQTRPPGHAEATELARRLEEPASRQQCESRPGYTLCADPGFAELFPYWGATVEGVLGAVPEAARPGDLTLRQRPLVDARAALPEPVARLVDPSVAWPNDDEVSLNGEWALPAPEDRDGPGQVQLSLGFRVASLLVGLPADVWWDPPSEASNEWASVPLDRADQPGPLNRCDAGGDARATVAVWLAGQATTESRAELRRRAGEVMARGQLGDRVSFDTVPNYRADIGLPDPVPEAGSAASGTDVVIAFMLLERSDVRDVLAEHWAEIVGAGGRLASSDDLLGWFGVDLDAAQAAVAANGPFTFDPHEGQSERTMPITGRCPAGRE